MALIKTITNASGSRPLAWVVATPTFGNVLVVRRTPHKAAITTKRSEYKSINESAAQHQAGWALDDQLLRALRQHDCKAVAVLVKKPGTLFMTDAANYHKAGVAYMVPKNKSGDRIRCVGLEHFHRRPYRAKV